MIAARSALLLTALAGWASWRSPAPRGTVPPGATRYVIAGYCWSDVPADCDNLVSFGTRRLSMDNLEDAAAMKAVTDRMPAGRRAIFLWDLLNDLTEHPADRCRTAEGSVTPYQGIWLDHGVARARERVDGFMRRYRMIGGRLDMIVLDYEGGLSNWHLGSDIKRWRAIQQDPRFTGVARQLGFRDLSTVGEWWRQHGDARLNYLRWNALMARRVAACLDQAVFEPARRYFPHVCCSNYGSYHYCRRLGVPDINGHRYYLFGSGAHVGTHQSGELYAWLGQIDRNPPEGLLEYPHTPFNGFRHALNEMRCMIGSSHVPVLPWIAYRGFSEGYVGVANHDLYQELVFHAGLSGADAFLFWNPRPWAPGQDPRAFTDDAQDRLFSDCLKQMNRLFGRRGRRTVTKGLVSWSEAYALSGMRAGDRTVWRFTPRLESGETRENTLVSRSPAAFRIGGATVTIPGGQVMDPENELSRQGYWVVAPATAAGPVVRRSP